MPRSGGAQRWKWHPTVSWDLTVWDVAVALEDEQMEGKGQKVLGISKLSWCDLLGSVQECPWKHLPLAGVVGSGQLEFGLRGAMDTSGRDELFSLCQCWSSQSCSVG